MSIVLQIDGTPYHRWTEASCERSLDNLSGKFEFKLAYADLSSSPELTKPFSEETEVKIFVNGELFLTGAIDVISQSGDKDNVFLNITGRSKTRNAIDSSVDHKSGQFNGQTPDQIIKEILSGVDLGFSDEESEKKPPLKIHRVYETETVGRAARRIARENGLNLTDNEKGEVVSFRPGAGGSGATIILGKDVINYKFTMDWSKRVKNVKAKGNSTVTDEKYGKAATDIGSAAIDEFVKSARKLNILSDNDQDIKRLRDRAVSEVKRRAGQSVTLSLEVSSFADSSGQLWKVNKEYMIEIPPAGIFNAMLLKSVKFEQAIENYRAILEFTPKGAYGGKEGKSSKKTQKVTEITGVDLGVEN